MKAPNTIADEGQPGGYASSCDEEDRQESEAMQELQEEVCRLHNQVWPMHRCHCMLCCTQSQKPLGKAKFCKIADFEQVFEEKVDTSCCTLSAGCVSVKVDACKQM